MEVTDTNRIKLLQHAEIRDMLQDHDKYKYQYYFIVGTLFAAFLLILAVLIVKMPPMDPDDKQIVFQIPNTKVKLSNTARILKKYSSSHYMYVLTLFVYLYIFLQSFAIPGPIFLSILSGALWSTGFGLFVVSICASIGASICYLLSQTFLKGVVINTWPNAIYTLRTKIDEKKNNLLFYMLFLRIQPLIPNIAVNLGSPISGIPLSIFFLGTLLGLVPLNIIHVNTGKALDDITTIGIKPKHVGILLILGFVTLIPTFIFKRNAKSKGL